MYLVAFWCKAHMCDRTAMGADGWEERLWGRLTLWMKLAACDQGAADCRELRVAGCGYQHQGLKGV